ncbi:hypothetical protein L1887_02883 [Cichorium endivia]|nr:hypothetical protein L1887_02883 [Cichorium endivia]
MSGDNDDSNGHIMVSDREKGKVYGNRVNGERGNNRWSITMEMCDNNVLPGDKRGQWWFFAMVNVGRRRMRMVGKIMVFLKERMCRRRSSKREKERGEEEDGSGGDGRSVERLRWWTQNINGGQSTTKHIPLMEYSANLNEYSATKQLHLS